MTDPGYATTMNLIIFRCCRNLINRSILFLSRLQVPERLYQLVDRSTDGLVTADQVMEFIAGLQTIRRVRNRTAHSFCNISRERVFVRRAVGYEP